jgi:hypothetical protein
MFQLAEHKESIEMARTALARERIGSLNEMERGRFKKHPVHAIGGLNKTHLKSKSKIKGLLSTSKSPKHTDYSPDNHHRFCKACAAK